MAPKLIVKRFDCWVRLFLCLVLGICFLLPGMNKQLARGQEPVQVYLPLVTRHIRFIESSGKLDTSFGQDGLVISDLSGSIDSGIAMTLLRDGKLLVGGEIAGTDSIDVGVARYNPDGSLDVTFGTGGWVSTDFYGSEDEAAAIAVQPDGKILLGCTSLGDFVLVRYNPDGSLDTTFGEAGWARTDIMGLDDEVKAVAVQPDGRIIMAGYGMNSTYTYDFALVRYLANGSLDTSFDEDGKVTNDLTGDKDQIRAIALLPDGKIIAVGPAKNGSHLHDFTVARYNSNGSLDTTFGTGGWTLTDFYGAHDFAYAVAVQSDGKIIVGGTADIVVGQASLAVARYTSGGNLDLTFGTNGRVTIDFSEIDDFGYAVALQPDGEIILAGYAYIEASYDFVLLRYLPNGSPDSSFGVNGQVTTDFLGGADKGLALALQLDGRIIMAGSADNGTNTDFALVRYK